MSKPAACCDRMRESLDSGLLAEGGPNGRPLLGGAAVAYCPFCGSSLAARARGKTRGEPAAAEHVDGLPAWTVAVAHPERFRDAEYDAEFRLFRLPQGALVACLLALFDVPEAPYFLHRVFDPELAAVRRYLEDIARGDGWLLVLRSRGSEPGFTRKLLPDASDLQDCLDAAAEYNGSLARADGAEALRRFLAVYEPEAARAGCEAGWLAVETWCRRQRGA